MIYKYLILFILFTLNAVNLAYAGLYDNCTMAWEFGDMVKQTIVVPVTGVKCNKACAVGCSQFAVLDSYKNNVNDDITEDCMAKCQSGQSYTSFYRVSSPVTISNTMNQFQLSSAPISVPKLCATDETDTSSASYNFVDSGIDIPAKSKFPVIFSFGIGNNSQVVSLCGFKTVNLYPNFYSLSPNSWDNNRRLWISDSNGPDNIGSSWNARVARWYNTGIQANDGDFVTISFEGPYSRYQDVSAYPPTKLDNSIIIGAKDIKLIRDLGHFPTDSLQYQAPQCPVGTDPIECTSISSSSLNSLGYQNVNSTNNNVKFLGLAGSTYDALLPKGIELLDGTTSYPKITFSGLLEGFGTEWSAILLKHYEGNNGNYSDNLGGKTVHIKWRGCPHVDGENLQYAVVPNSNASNTNLTTLFEPSSNSNWVDVNKGAFYGNFVGSNTGVPQIEIDGGNTGGRLFFRIKPQDHPYASSNPQSQYYTPANSLGSYSFTMYYNNQAEVRLAGTVFRDIVKQIRAMLFGDDKGNLGVAQIIYKEIVSEDKGYVNAIRAMLILYIVTTGIMFILGVAQMNQGELIIRTIKISIVCMLISPSSWDFFNTYIFSVFQKGSLELIALFFSDPDMHPETAVAIAGGDLEQVFTYIDKPMSVILFGSSGGLFGTGFLSSTSPTWHKMQALVMTNMFGALMYAVLLVGAVMYLIAIFKAFLIYLLSLVGIAIMIIVAPIFISFILFAKTREMFDAWIKLLFSFSFQPVLVFAMLGVVSKMLLFTLYSVLGYTVCQVCAIKIFTWCPVTSYIPLSYAHSGGGWFAAPISSLSGGFIFLVLSMATIGLIDLMASLSTQIISGAFFGVHLGQLTQTANPVTKTVEMIEAITGSSTVNSDVRKGREKIIASKKKARPLGDD